MKKISVHTTKHRKPEGDHDFGYYLAGVMDANSSIKNNILSIPDFEEYRAAYLIKRQLGYGKIQKNQKGMYDYILSKEKGIEKVGNLVQDKLLVKNLSFFLHNNVICYNLSCSLLVFNKEEDKRRNKYTLGNTYWTSGFLSKNGSFIKKSIKEDEEELGIEISHDNESLLLFIKENGKGKIRLHQVGVTASSGKENDKGTRNHYIYYTTTYESIYNFIHYLQKYPLQCQMRYLDYGKMKKSYVRKQEK